MYEHIVQTHTVLPQGVTLADVFREHPKLARVRREEGEVRRRGVENGSKGGNKRRLGLLGKRRMDHERV